MEKITGDDFDLDKPDYIGVYIGEEFTEEYFGKKIDIWDDHSKPDFPCYAIRFHGSNEIIGNMDDEDIEF